MWAKTVPNPEKNLVVWGPNKGHHLKLSRHLGTKRHRCASEVGRLEPRHQDDNALNESYFVPVIVCWLDAFTSHFGVMQVALIAQ